MSFDPLSGSGITMAIETGVDAAHAILRNDSNSYRVSLHRSFSVTWPAAIRSIAGRLDKATAHSGNEDALSTRENQGAMGVGCGCVAQSRTREWRRAQRHDP